jgi:hypothetical protein
LCHFSYCIPPGNHHLFEKDFDLFLGRIGKGVQAGDLQGAAKEFAATGNIDSELAVAPGDGAVDPPIRRLDQ